MNKLFRTRFLSWASGEDPPSVIISVVDASNLSRNLFLTSQLIDLDIPVVIALNMIDRLEDVKQLDFKGPPDGIGG